MDTHISGSSGNSTRSRPAICSGEYFFSLQPDTFVSLGKASGHLNRAGQSGAVKAPRAARLLWLVSAAGIAVNASVPVAVVAIAGPKSSTLTGMKAWWLVIFGVTFLGYVLPALVQSYLGGGADSWKAATAQDTGRPRSSLPCSAAGPARAEARQATGTASN